jgi:hypothetical protein
MDPNNYLQVACMVCALAVVWSSLRTLKSLFKLDNTGFHITLSHFGLKRRVFMWLCWAMVWLFLGLLIETINEIFGIIPLWLSGVLILFANGLWVVAFAEFWYKSASFHSLHLREKIFGALMGILVAIGVLILIKNVLTHSSMTRFDAEFYLMIINIILISTALILTFVVYPRVKAGVIDNSLRYITSGIFTYFLSFLLQTYVQFSSKLLWLDFLSWLLFFGSLVYFWCGFVAARRYHIRK